MLKDRLARLAPAVLCALSAAEEERARKLAEQALRESHEELEVRVRERTAELTSANAALKDEKAAQEMLIKKLADAQGQLLQSEKMASLGLLKAGLAHEINNPIGFVYSNLGALKRYSLEKLKHRIDIAYLCTDIDTLISETMSGLQRVTNIVRDMKEFAHVG